MALIDKLIDNRVDVNREAMQAACDKLGLRLGIIHQADNGHGRPRRVIIQVDERNDSGHHANLLTWWSDTQNLRTRYFVWLEDVKPSALPDAIESIAARELTKAN